MDSVITHFFWLPLQHEQLADGRKVRFGVRSSRSKNLRIAFDTSGSMVDGSQRARGRTWRRGDERHDGGGGASTAGPQDPKLGSGTVSRGGANRGARNTDLSSLFRGVRFASFDGFKRE